MLLSFFTSSSILFEFLFKFSFVVDMSQKIPISIISSYHYKGKWCKARIKIPKYSALKTQSYRIFNGKLSLWKKCMLQIVWKLFRMIGICHVFTICFYIPICSLIQTALTCLGQLITLQPVFFNHVYHTKPRLV